MKAVNFYLATIAILILLSGCHGGWVNQTCNYNIGVTRTEYRDGHVKYRRECPAESWRNYERFVKDNEMQQQAKRITKIMEE